MNKKSPSIKFQVKPTTTMAALAARCEAACVALPKKCHAFYQHVTGACYLFKVPGRLLKGRFATVRACQVSWAK
jgi:hypothetical protein